MDDAKKGSLSLHDASVIIRKSYIYMYISTDVLLYGGITCSGQRYFPIP